jgi:L-iditol 2-dehydrogenase
MNQTMRAAVYRGVNQIGIETVAVPAIEAGEVLIRVAACGICGTDLKKVHHGLVPPPRIFGHETAGTIAAVGEGVTDWQVGDRVVVNHHVPCLRDECFYCRRRAFAQCPVYKRTGTTAGFEPAGGGFAEYVRVMDWCVDRGMVHIPDDVSFEEASFVEPLNTCLKAVRLADVQEGDTVWVIGQGPIGLLFTQLVRRAGARVIVTDNLLYRLETARQLGAEVALPPDDGGLAAAIQDLSEGRGADLVIVAVPTTQVVPSAFTLLRPGGKVLLFAHTRLNDPLEVDAGAICMQEKTLLGSYSSDILLQDEAAQLIFERHINVRDLISHRFPLEAIHDAIDYASHPHDNSLKVILDIGF